MKTSPQFAAPNMSLQGEAGVPAGALRFIRDDGGNKILQMFSFEFADAGSGYKWITVPFVEDANGE